MIVRILGEGQYRLDDEAFAARTRSTTASRRRPTPATRPASRPPSPSWWTRSSASATPLPADELEGSDAIVPGHGTTLAEARELLSSEGLIPG